MKVYSAVAGMIAQTNKLDLIANNMANINTTGFKETLANTKTFTRDNNISNYPKLEDLPFEENSKKAKEFINNTFNQLPVLSNTYKNNIQGSFKETGNPLDFSLINKDTFFLVEDKLDGSFKLTRDGSFQLDSDGNITTKEGHYILSDSKQKLTIQEVYSEIGVVKHDLQTLDNIGNNNYKIENINKLEFKETIGEVKSGYLENSNVNVVATMTKLIQAQRLFDQLKSVVDTQQDLDKKSNSNIGDYQS